MPAISNWSVRRINSPTRAYFVRIIEFSPIPPVFYSYALLKNFADRVKFARIIIE